MELLVIAAVLFLVFRGLSRGADHVDGAQPVGWAPDTNWRVVAPLARSDLRLMLRHPAFVAGVLLTPLMLFAATESASSWRDASTAIALALVPLGWLTIIAVNLVALRPRRTGTDELFAALPAPQPVRTTAILATMFGPVLVAAILAVAWLPVVGIDEVRGSPRWDEIAVGLLIIAGSVCVGVAVARWLPNAGFGVLAAIATIIIQARFLDVTTWPWDRNEGDQLRFLAFIAEPTSVTDDVLEIRPSLWHLLYLGGLVATMAGVALARDGIRRPVAVMLSAGALIAAGAGWMQTRPLSAAQEDAMVSYLTEPAAHQICEDSARARLCAYSDFTADVPDWANRVEATLEALPEAALEERTALQVTQRPAIIVSNDDCSPVAFEDGLPPGVAARVSPELLWPADGRVHPPFAEESFPCSERDTSGFFLAAQTGAWAVGLPPTPHGRNERCTANGQARAVVALWAAADATPDGARALRDVINEGSENGILIDFADWDDPPMWGVDYTVADAEIALAMLDLPASDVRDTLARNWVRWVDPATTSAALALDLELTEVGATSSSSNDGRCP